MRLRRLGAASVALTLLGASAPCNPGSDPVMAARAQRAAAQGVAEDDLPPVPRTILEPPPLPPPEIHPKDLRPRRGARRSAAQKKSGPAKKGTAVRKGGVRKKGSGKAARKKGQ